MQQKFKIRCSQIGKIISEPKNKADKEAGFLGETAKNYCELWVKENIVYNRKKEFKSKYTEKGNFCEQYGIDRYNIMFNQNIEKYNGIQLENEFLTGNPDSINSGLIDIKNSFDFDTFPLFKSICPEIDYTYQLNGYMALTGLNTGKIVYTLEDMPDKLIESELRKLNLDFNEENVSRYKYFDIPDQYRIKVFEIKRDDILINKIYSQVEKCRNYINSLKY